MPLDAKLYWLGGQSARYHNVNHVLGSQFAIIMNFAVYLLSTITSSDENGAGSSRLFGNMEQKHNLSSTENGSGKDAGTQFSFPTNVYKTRITHRGNEDQPTKNIDLCIEPSRMLPPTPAENSSNDSHQSSTSSIHKSALVRW